MKLTPEQLATMLAQPQPQQRMPTPDEIYQTNLLNLAGQLLHKVLDRGPADMSVKDACTRAVNLAAGLLAAVDAKCRQ